MSGRRLGFSRYAEDDLRSILEYSETHWGVHQRDVRAEQLLRVFENLLVFPGLGKVVRQIDDELFGVVSNEHIVFYRFDDERLLIVRILHRRMDAEAHLKGL